MGRLKILPLISGTGSNLKAIYDACGRGIINGEVIAVGSDNAEAKGLLWAKDKGIPTFAVDYSFRTPLAKAMAIAQKKDIPSDFDIEDILMKEHIRPVNELIWKKINYLKARAIKEAELLAQMRMYPFDLVVLAGFMKVLTPYFIDRVNLDGTHRIMNIHPALLPAFPGEHGYEDTFKYGCKIGGCTVHFVDYGEDTGPIIGQKTYEIHPGDTLDAIKERGLANEWKLYPECIQLFAEGRLKVVERGSRKVVDVLQ